MPNTDMTDAMAMTYTPEDNRRDNERRRVEAEERARYDTRMYEHHQHVQSVQINNNPSNLWVNGTGGTGLTASNLQDAYEAMATTPLISANAGQYVQIDPHGEIEPRQGHHYSGVWMDEASEAEEREPPCNDLGEFLLMKYNKRKVVPV